MCLGTKDLSLAEEWNALQRHRDKLLRDLIDKVIYLIACVYK